jgi:hypothetical protein
MNSAAHCGLDEPGNGLWGASLLSHMSQPDRVEVDW